jgi:hypothetical protein
MKNLTKIDINIEDSLRENFDNFDIECPEYAMSDAMFNLTTVPIMKTKDEDKAIIGMLLGKDGYLYGNCYPEIEIKKSRKDGDKLIIEEFRITGVSIRTQ